MPTHWAGPINTQLEIHHDLVNGARESEKGRGKRLILFTWSCNTVWRRKCPFWIADVILKESSLNWEIVVGMQPWRSVCVSITPEYSKAVWLCFCSSSCCHNLTQTSLRWPTQGIYFKYILTVHVQYIHPWQDRSMIYFYVSCIEFYSNIRSRWIRGYCL